MSHRNESLLDVLSKSPWWVSLGLTLFSYVGLRHVLTQTAAKGLAQVAPLFSLVFLAPAIVSLVHSWRRRRLLDLQQGLRTIRSLSWRQFEELVGEAYRRMGYSVKENAGHGPDDGIDLTLIKDGDLVLVRCKQWRARKVGVKTVRELYGVMTANQASSGTVITSGTFTHEARLFAINKPIDLVDGKRLAALVGGIQTKSLPTLGIAQTKTCPECGAHMVKRVARRGSHAGETFWGCSAFPDCRTIAPLAHP